MRGKKLTVAQMHWLNDYGVKDPRKYLMLKNTPTLFQIKHKVTGDVIKFRKIPVGRRGDVTLELIPTDRNGKEFKNPCSTCDAYDPDYESCTIPSVDKSYACPYNDEGGTDNG